jgi:hypothetical protein
MIASRPCGKSIVPSSVPHVWFDSRNRLSASKVRRFRPVEVWAAPCSLTFCLATTRSRTLADRALAIPCRRQLSDTPQPVALVRLGEGDVDACLLGDYQSGFAYSAAETMKL